VPRAGISAIIGPMSSPPTHSATPKVRLRLADDSVWELASGDLIGRCKLAALPLNAPHISEAHAMVSLRGSQMRLLALRGRVTVHGKFESEIALARGTRFVLGGRTAVLVEEVILPDVVLALAWHIEGRHERHVLEGVTSLVIDPTPRLVRGFDPDATATFWTRGSDWWARVGGEDRRLSAGDAIEVPGRTRLDVTVVNVPLGALARHATGPARDEEPLTLTLRYESVHIWRDSSLALSLDGIPARIVSELALMRAPVAWEVVAQEVWPGIADRSDLRERWDSALARLRKKLAAGRVRTDLVRSTMNGNVELMLGVDDVIVDES